MKILVTGANGMIGKAFVRNYKNVFEIVAPSPDQVNMADARSLEKLFKANRFDAVLHLALLGNRDMAVDNLIMFKNIQYIAIAHGVKKMIVLGDGVEFDMTKPIVDYTEDMFGKNIPLDGFGMGRYLISLLASKDRITTLLRVFDIFGEGDNSLPINKIVAAGARGKKQIVLDSDRVVSAVAIEDAIKVIASMLLRDIPKGDYNLVADEKVSLLEVAKTVKRAVRRDGFDIDIVVKNPVPAPEYSAKNDKLLSVMPIKFTPVLSGVKKLYDRLKK